MKRIPLVDFIKSECELAKPVEIMIAIYSSTNGQPCTDCGYRHDCQVRHKLEAANQEDKKKPFVRTKETNKQIAKRLGISSRQVSKLKKANALK